MPLFDHRGNLDSALYGVLFEREPLEHAQRIAEMLVRDRPPEKIANLVSEIELNSIIRLTRLLVVATLLLTVTNLLAQVAPSLVGTWVAVPDSNGAVFPHLEELRIARDGGVVTAVYGPRRLPECDDKASALSGPCAVGRTNAKGRLVVDNVGQTIALASMVLDANAMAGIGLPVDERLSRDIFWFGPGKPWKFRGEEGALVMSRQSRPFVPNTSLDGTKVVTVEKWYFPVDDGFAGDAIALAEAGSFSVAKLLCIMPVFTNSAVRGRAFRTLVREISLRPHSKPGDELLFSVLKPHEAQIRACHEHNFK